METRVAEFSQLVGLFYEGISDATLWRQFLQEVCHRFDCDKATLVFHDPENRQPTIVTSIGASEAARAFEADYGKRNDWGMMGLRLALRDGFWGSLNQLTQHPGSLDTDYYREFLQPQDIFHAALGIVRNESRHLTSLSIMRPKSAGLLGEDLADFIRLLGPHLKRAFQIQKKLATLRTASESPKTALDHWDTGVIAVDRNGRVLMVNSAAERILKSGRAVMVSRYRLVAINHSQQDQLERLIKAAAMTGAGLGTASGGAILLLGKDSNPISVVATHRSESNACLPRDLATWPIWANTSRMPIGCFIVRGGRASECRRADAYHCRYCTVHAETRFSQNLD
jgi:PAS domain-containing protein